MDYKKIKTGITSLIYGPKNLILRATTEWLKPEYIWIEITDKCNAHCKFCNIWRKRPTSNPLTPEEVEKVLSDPLFKNLKRILISGGEPMLRHDLEEIILRIHNVLPKTSILFGTNCILAKRVVNFVEFAVEHDIDIEAGISIDGIGEKHDEARGIKGIFKQVDLVVNELVKLRDKKNGKPNLVLGFVLTNDTISSLEDVKKYAKEKNVPLSVQWYNESSYYDNVGKNLLSGNDRLIKVAKNLEPNIINEIGIKLLKRQSIKFPCFAMYNFCLIKCNGDIVPCFNLWDFKVGNIRERSPTEIWHNSNAKKARKIVKKCEGCLNACGVGWSFVASVYPILLFGLKHPLALFKKFLNGKLI